MSDFLRAKGLAVLDGYRPENLEPAPDLVVVGNALSRGNPEVEALLDRRLPYCSLPDFLRERFFPGRRVTAVCGTHGKTTITTLLAWLLESAGRSPTFLAGGIALNFDGGYRLGTGEDFVIEGDEYDTAFFDKRSKFLGVPAAQRRAGEHRVRPRGHLRLDGGVHAGVPAAGEPRAGQRLSRREPADAVAREVAAPCRGADRPGRAGRRRRLRLPAARRALPARRAARGGGRGARSASRAEEIARGMATYRGVKRRLEAVFSGGGVTLYDDFAHHPTAIRLDLETLRAKHPGARIRALFEPRSNTLRRAIFQQALAGGVRRGGRGDRRRGAPRRAARRRRTGSTRGGSRARSRRPGGARARSRTSAAIAAAVLDDLRPGDVVAVLSNGSFGGLMPLLRGELETWAATRR